MDNTDPRSGSPDPVEPPQGGDTDSTVNFTKTPEDDAGAPGPGAPGAAPPPPGDPWLGLRGLRRTREPRIIAGVCGGLGRATNVDPILFRVILAVLAVFGGLGLAIYLILWLLLPLEGEDASPLEALFGRGRSSTGPVLTVVLAIVAAFATVGTFSEFRNVVLGAAVAVGLVLLLQRSGVLPAGAYIGFARSTPPAYAGGPSAAAGYTGASAPGYADAPVTPGYAPPFAPRGPWGGHQRWQAGHHGRPVPPVPPIPRRRRERSVLGRLTISMICLALAFLGAVDLVGTSIPAVVYWGTALGVTAAGLLIGAWFGRARGLIALGILLVIATSVAGTADHVTNNKWRDHVLWAPTSVAAIAPSYEARSGEATLDLRGVDFAGGSKETHVKLGAGDLTIQLPPNVNVDVNASVGIGSSTIFGKEANGFGINRGTSEQGDDPARGTLTLTVDLGAGDLEITR